MRSVWLVLACGSAAAAPAVKLTAKVAAPCAPDYLERHATSLADLDGNGTLDRAGITREGGQLVVKLYELPAFKVAGSWTVPDGYVEIATPRRRGSTRGDLWITVGRGDAKTWQDTLYHLEGGKLATITTTARQVRIRVDVDGDGRVDPIAYEDGSSKPAVRALRADGTWQVIPAASPSGVYGAPAEYQQQEALDLDGNGVKELVVQTADGLAIVEGGKQTWAVKGAPYEPRIVKWGAGWVLAVNLDEKLRVYALDARHALVADYPKLATYATVAGVVGTQLVVASLPMQFFERANPRTAVGTMADLAKVAPRIDDPVSPFAPLRLVPADAPGLVVLDGDRATITLVDPRTHAKRRSVWTSAQTRDIAHDLHVWPVDLDRDGAAEILVEETHSIREHHGASWNTGQLRLLDGRGTQLWAEPGARSENYHSTDRSKPPAPRDPGTHVRAFDLGDGTIPLRVRSSRDEYYLLAGSSKITAIPACLE